VPPQPGANGRFVFFGDRGGIKIDLTTRTFVVRPE
jgi:hypothetical protein